MNQPEQHEELVFEAALKLPAEQRAGYLDEACAGDADLRRRVEVLLGAFERASEFMTHPTNPERTERLSTVTIEKAGDRIGRYKLLQQIGEGGCGVVYMAEQEVPVRRRVALKVIKLGMDTKQVVARFEAERQALALMDHPNIARVLDAGATDAGRPYFVMELVRGIKITDFCDEQKLSTPDRLKLFLQVCQAVQHAHQKGIIHRDLKPSNILVTVNDGVPLPKVIDFGIAKATTGQALTDKTLFTAFEQFIGTPVYMSPEQAVLTSLDIDTRSDIYSLGVLLYELLTGRTPFDQKALLASGFDAMRRAIREQEPPRPSSRLTSLALPDLTTTAERRQTDAPKLLHAVRGDLDWIVMKALEKDRGRRYETANGLARDIERHLANEPVVARPPSAVYRLQKAARRNRAAFTAAASIVLILVVAVIVSVSQAVRAERKERKSDQVARFLKDMLTGVDPSVAMGRDTRMLREILDQTADRVGRDLKNLPEVEAELRGTIGDVYQLISEYEKAEAMYRRALELRRKLAGETQPEVARLLNNLGVTLYSWDKLPEAEDLLREALALRRTVLGPRTLEVAGTLYHQSALLRRKGNLNEAETAIRESLAIRREILGNEHRLVAEAIQGLATVLRRQDRLKEAETAMREALTMRTRLDGGESPTVADMTQELGEMLADQNRQVEAEVLLKEALAKLRKLLGATHRQTLTCMAMLLNTLLAEEKFDEAEKLARECWLTRQRLMPDEARTFNVQSLLGGCLVGLGRYPEAEPLLLSAYEVIKRKLHEGEIPWEGRYVVGETMKRIIQLYEATGRTEKAAEWKLRLAEFGAAKK